MLGLATHAGYRVLASRYDDAQANLEKKLGPFWPPTSRHDETGADEPASAGLA
jgi:hypothetical protein